MSVGLICGNTQKNCKSGYLFHLKEVMDDKDCHGVFSFSHLFCHMPDYYSL